MRLIGNLTDIKTQRENKHKSIELYLDQIEYITSKKDGKYFQEFNFVEHLDTPLLISGDRLARTFGPDLEENEYEFQVYDKVDEEYVLNPDKYLSVLMVYDFDLDETILTSVYYTVTVSAEEFKEIEKVKTKEKSFRNRKKNRKK